MSLISFTFVLFYIVLIVLYYTCMRKKQWLLLLAGSLVFYAYASPYYLIFLMISACTVFLGAKGISAAPSDKKRLKNGIFAAVVILNLLILAVLKYTNFVIDNINSISGKSAQSLIPHLNWLLPLGISYYTFIVIGYLTDVYREVIPAEEDYLKFLMFVSYFPHITQGPINRFDALMPQLSSDHEFDWIRIRRGLYRILIGLSKKLIIAERLSVYVDRVFAAPSSYDGLSLLIAAVFYAIQIYCDFSGYMDMVLGLSGMLGIDMAENFNLPYFSESIPEFWRRWHITLGEWFKDYLYYPVLRSSVLRKLSKSMKKSKISFSKTTIRMVPVVIALVITWSTTGIWHGASWHYGFWGLYHGILIILSTTLATSFGKINKALHINTESGWWKAFRIIRTFILVDIGYVFFRAVSVGDALLILKRIPTTLRINGSSISAAILPFTEDNTAISYGLVVCVAVLVLFVCELKKYVGEVKTSELKKTELRADGLKAADEENSDNRTADKRKYIFAAVMIVAIMLFGIFGQSSFIYMMY